MSESSRPAPYFLVGTELGIPNDVESQFFRVYPGSYKTLEDAVYALEKSNHGRSDLWIGKAVTYRATYEEINQPKDQS